MLTPALTLTLLQEFRGLPADLSLTFDAPLIALVGENGSGKSALLRLLKSFWSGHYGNRISDPQKTASLTGLEHYAQKFDFCSEGDSGHGRSFSDMDFMLKYIGHPTNWKKSSGQMQQYQINQLLAKLAPRAKAGEQTLLVLDEPERAQSIGKVAELGVVLSLLTERLPIQIILATHSPELIRLTPRIYDVTARTWSTGEEYLAEVTRQAEVFRDTLRATLAGSPLT